MPNSTEAICQYLQDTITAETAFEERLRSFAQEGDDEEVQLAFAEYADESQLHVERLSQRLRALSAGESQANTGLAELLDLAPQFGQAGHTVEERIVQNLITAFCIEAGECAMYEALAHVARVAGDEVTETLAHEMLGEEQRAAEKIFHFLPTRSKIAFNMLTAHETDPAVETKVGMV